MPRPPQCMLAKKMGGQDATLSPSAILLKTWAGKMPRPPQYNLAKIMGGQEATPSPVHAC